MATIDTDVLALLNGWFHQAQNDLNALGKAIDRNRVAIGTDRASDWIEAVSESLAALDLMACDECQDAPYNLASAPDALHAICDKHAAALSSKPPQWGVITYRSDE